jgi:aspartyl-tRNA(Asn)/glutamyl-tRNA(Gln) amidotransferase subunit A
MKRAKGNNPATLTILEAAALIRSRMLSPVELTRACLDRITAWEPSINAFITVTADQALEAAFAHERMISEGYYLGPLHGVPIGIKDNIYTAGVRTTAGSKVLADNIPDSDATVVARLRNAGAVILGKLNMHEFATGATNDNPHYGPTRNPWDPNRSPAGSSGGSGAAVAACEVLGALGTDTGGSIRLPASVNGCVGIRPTVGRVSNFNVVPLAWSMDTVGPMARAVDDVAAMLSVIAGYDLHDAGTDARPVPDYLAQIANGINGFRIGVISDYFFSDQQECVRKAVLAAIDCLVALGGVVQEVRSPDISGSISARLTIEQAEAFTYHQKWLRDRPNDYGDDVRGLLQLGETYSANDYIHAQRYRSQLRSEVMDAFRDVDVFISPTVPFVATPVRAAKVLIDEGREVDILATISRFTGLPSLAGLPSMSVTCGFSDDGLPIGMQLTGRPFDEATIFRIGHTYQEVTTWHQRQPMIPADNLLRP